MTDVVIDPPAEAAPVPPAPEVVELEAAAAPAEPDPEADAPAAAHEHEHPIGSLRQRVLDHLVDSEGPQSVGQIIAGAGNYTRNTVEGCLRRMLVAGEIERIAAGTYALPTPKPAESAPPPPEAKPALEPDPARIDAAMERDRQRKQQERQRDRDAAAAKREEANRELRAKLIAACRHGNRQNYAPGLASDDLTPIKMLLAVGVSTDVIELAVRWRTETEALTSWRDQPLLQKAWHFFGKLQILPRLMEGREKAPPNPADASETPAAGPVPPEAKGAPEASARELDMRGLIRQAGEGQATTTVAPALLTDDERPAAEHLGDDAQNGVVSNDPIGRPPVADRAQILAGFRRAPAPPQPTQRQPAPEAAEKPWFAGERQQPQPAGGMTDDGWRFLLEGWRAGTIVWARKHGPPPGDRNCRVPRRILREFGL